jgi:hypothetical protein
MLKSSYILYHPFIMSSTDHTNSSRIDKLKKKTMEDIQSSIRSLENTKQTKKIPKQNDTFSQTNALRRVRAGGYMVKNNTSQYGIANKILTPHWINQSKSISSQTIYGYVPKATHEQSYIHTLAQTRICCDDDHP